MNCIPASFTDHDVIAMMDGCPPPIDDLDALDAYFQVFYHRLDEVFGEDAHSTWVLLAHSGEYWDLDRNRSRLHREAEMAAAKSA